MNDPDVMTLLRPKGAVGAVARPRTSEMRRPREFLARMRLLIACGVALASGCTEARQGIDIAPANPPRVVAADYFGGHFHRLGFPEGVWRPTEWPAGLVGALRLWDSTTRWADLEPQPGRYAFGRADHYVDEARAHGAPVLFVLGSPAPWASARPNERGPYGPGSAAEPRDLDAWDRYVVSVVQRYKGRVAQYELWNEPYFSDLPEDRGHPSAFYSGSVATMVELARRTRDVIRRIDPAATLLSPGFVGAPKRLALFLDAGGGRYIDAVAYHFYAEDDRAFVQLFRDVRAVMAAHGLAAMPLVNTESGFALRGSEGEPLPDGMTPIDRRIAAALLARSLVLGAFLGLDRFYQYAWDNGRMGMLLSDGRTETDSLRSYTAVHRWLVGTTLLGCQSQGNVAIHCSGRRGDQQVVIGWTTALHNKVDLFLPAAMAVTAIEPSLAAVNGTPPVLGGTVRLPEDGSPLAVWMCERPMANGSKP